MPRFALLILLVACKADPIPTTEGLEPGQCSDDADNDADGLFDCRDPDCVTAEICQVQPGDDTGTINVGGLSETAFQSQAITEACRILVLCDFYASVAECELSVGEPEAGCDYDNVAAESCLQGMGTINSCPDPFELPTACEEVYVECDSGL